MRTATALFVLAALAVVAWFVLDGREPPAPALAVPTSPKSEAAAAVPAAAEVPADASPAPKDASQRIAAPTPVEGPAPATRPDRTLHVRVLDAAGHPAPGVLVVALRTAERSMDLGLGTTDAAGLCTRAHVQELARDAATCPIEVCARFPGGASAAVAVEATEPPPEVVLRLPATGQVVVHVRDAEGKPIAPHWLGNAVVNLTTWTEKPADERSVREGGNRAETTAPIDERGDALFAVVTLGGFVRADAGSWSPSEIVPGPTLADPRVEVTARESADSVVFTGTMLDVDGQPLVDRDYQLSCHHENGMSGTNAKTHAGGAFRVCLGAWPASTRATLTFSTGKTGDRDAMCVELSPRDVRKGRNDLGEVRLAHMPVIARGRAVGDAPPDRIPVVLQFERKRGEQWRGEWRLQPEWKDGAFVLRGPVPVGTPMRVVVQTNSFLPVAPIEFAAGATDLEIPLHRGGSLAATFLVDVASIPARWMQLQRVDPPLAPGEREGSDGSTRGDVQQAVDGKVQRAWPGLPPGRYRLEVRGDGAAEPLALVDAIDVGEGPCTDPRLSAIDLRGRVRTFAIRAVGADGNAIARREAFVIVRAGGAWTGYNLGAGAVTLTAAAAVDLLVAAPGHRAAFVDQVFDARTVALEAAPPTTFAFNLPTALPDGVQLRLFLYPRVDVPDVSLSLDTGRSLPARDFFKDEVVVGADGKALVSARMPGVHRIAVNLRGSTRGTEVPCEPHTATLPLPGEFAVRLDVAAWQKALQTLGR